MLPTFDKTPDPPFAVYGEYSFNIILQHKMYPRMCGVTWMDIVGNECVMQLKINGYTGYIDMDMLCGEITKIWRVRVRYGSRRVQEKKQTKEIAKALCERAYSQEES